MEKELEENRENAAPKDTASQNDKDAMLQQARIQIKDAVSRLVTTAKIVSNDIDAKNKVWAYADSIKERAKTICVVTLGSNLNIEKMSVVDMMSAIFTIERDILFSGWSDDITGKVADALTFDKDSYDNNSGIVAYFIDACAFVANSFEAKAYIESVNDEEIQKSLEDLKPVIELMDKITEVCK